VVTWGGLGRLRDPALPDALSGRGWGGAADGVAPTSEDPMTKPKSKPKARARSTTRKSTKLASRKRSVPASSRPVVRPDTKHARVIAMLRKPAGTTIAAIVAATNWQQHSVRGFLAGVVRKKLGLNLVSDQTDKGRVYRIKEGRVSPAATDRAQQAA
jgi:Protein of unknown function (DUF3489)